VNGAITGAITGATTGAITGAITGAMKGAWPDGARSRGAHHARAVKRFRRSRAVALQDGFCKMGLAEAGGAEYDHKGRGARGWRWRYAASRNSPVGH
jgi:hypothetical protein